LQTRLCVEIRQEFPLASNRHPSSQIIRNHKNFAINASIASVLESAALFDDLSALVECCLEVHRNYRLMAAGEIKIITGAASKA
jgi:hypothetical protein